MKTDRTTLLVVGVAAVVLVGTLGFVLGVPGLDGGDAGPADDDEAADPADDASDPAESDGDSDGQDESDAPAVEFDGDEPIELDPADATISGTADVDEGTELTVNLMTVPNASTAFFLLEEITVGEDGSFEAEFDFSSISADEGTELEVVARTGDEADKLGNAMVTLAAATSDDRDEDDRVEFDGEEPFELTPEEATVSGTADVDEGTELMVELESTANTGQGFFISKDITAGADGTFEVEFAPDDLALDEDTEAKIVVRLAEDITQLGTAEALVPATESDGDDADDSEETDRVEFDGDEPIELDPADATISGTADVEEGTELDIQLVTASDQETAFFMLSTVTVGDDGEFEATYDFDADTADPGTEAEVIVSVDDGTEDIGSADVVVVEPSEELESPPAAEDVLDVDHEEPLELTAGENTLSGTADELDAGEEVTVVVRNVTESGSEPIQVETTATVDEDGAFTADVDTSEFEPGTELEIVFIHPDADGALLLEGTVVE